MGLKMKAKFIDNPEDDEFVYPLILEKIQLYDLVVAKSSNVSSVPSHNNCSGYRHRSMPQDQERCLDDESED